MPIGISLLLGAWESDGILAVVAATTAGSWQNSCAVRLRRVAENGLVLSHFAAKNVATGDSGGHIFRRLFAARHGDRQAIGLPAESTRWASKTPRRRSLGEVRVTATAEKANRNRQGDSVYCHAQRPLKHTNIAVSKVV